MIPEDDVAGAAVLRANRSMCYLSMGDSASALSDAEKAESLDSSYVKVYYRKAAALKALNRFSEAKAAILKGLQLKADDKDMKALLVKIDADIAGQGSVSGKAASAVPAARSTVTTSSKAAATATTSAPASAAKSAPSPVTNTASADDDDDDTALGNIRGYKKTADGRTTTFFNNELDETAKRLIGDIAPKKLESAADVVVDSAALANGSSVWNSAGTYEERLLTPWATSELKTQLGSLAGRVDLASAAMDAREWASFASTSPLETVDVCITEVESVTGDAQVSMIRGKKKHLCDYVIELKWSLTMKHATSAEPETVAGKVSVLDLTADKEYEFSAFEVTHFNGKAAHQSVLPLYAGLLYNTYIKKSSSAQPRGLQRLVHDSLMRFCDTLKTK